MGSVHSSMVSRWNTGQGLSIVELCEELLHHCLIVACRVTALGDELAVALVIIREEILLSASRLIG
jgi:hypothetical protein